MGCDRCFDLEEELRNNNSTDRCSKRQKVRPGVECVYIRLFSRMWVSGLVDARLLKLLQVTDSSVGMKFPPHSHVT